MVDSDVIVEAAVAPEVESFLAIVDGLSSKTKRRNTVRKVSVLNTSYCTNQPKKEPALGLVKLDCYQVVRIKPDHNHKISYDPASPCAPQIPTFHLPPLRPGPKTLNPKP